MFQVSYPVEPAKKEQACGFKNQAVNSCLSINGHFTLTLRCFQNLILRYLEVRDIAYMPVVKFIKRLDLVQNCSSMDRQQLTSRTNTSNIDPK